jgi:S-DNA-T family DNA segregation ATPase FtsK/SpoIIIE
VRGARLPAGRGFTRDSLELQCALPGRDPSGEGQARTLAERAAELTARFGPAEVPGIAPLPSNVRLDELPAPAQPFEAVLGLGDAELEPVRVSLADRHFVVAGPYRSGRSSALATLATSLAAGPRPPELHLLAPRRSPLVDLPLWTNVASGAEACEDAAARLTALVQEGPPPAPLVVVVDDGDELAEAPSALALETVVRRGRDLDVRVIAAAERQALARAFAGFLRELRKDEHGLLLDPDLDIDGDLLGVRLPRRTNPVFPPGRGFLVERGLMELVQVGSPWA